MNQIWTPQGLTAQPTVLAGFFSGEFLGAVAGGMIGGLASLIVVFIHLRSDRRSKDDELFGRALKAVMAWAELPFRRLRARDDSKEQIRELRLRFHELQEELLWHQSWIGFRSNKLGDKYKELVDTIKGLVGPSLQTLQDDPRDSDPNYGKGELNDDMGKARPKIEEAVKEFRNSVRHRRSWYGWVWERMPEKGGSNGE